MGGSENYDRSANLEFRAQKNAIYANREVSKTGRSFRCFAKPAARRKITPMGSLRRGPEMGQNAPVFLDLNRPASIANAFFGAPLAFLIPAGWSFFGATETAQNHDL